MLRAIRFAANLEFGIEPSTKAAITKQAAKISRISRERILDELNKIILRAGARRGLELLVAAGLLDEILPELDRLRGIAQPPLFHPEGDVWQHTLIMLDLFSHSDKFRRNMQLAWGILLHDVGKAVTRSENEKGIHFYGHVRSSEVIAEVVMRRLRFSRADREAVINLIRYHMMFMNVQQMRKGRLKRFLGMPDFDLHLELHRLDCVSSHGMLDNYYFCLEELQKLEEEDLHPRRLLTGHDLISLGYAPGKAMGEILHALEDAQLEGSITTREQAEDFIRNRWSR